MMLRLIAALCSTVVVFERPPEPRFDARPSPALDARAVIDLSLSALAANDRVRPDAGVRLAWRFASPDYKAQHGSFEAMRRAFHAPALAPLLQHRETLVDPSPPGAGRARVVVIALGDRGEPLGFVFELARSERTRDCWLIAGIRRISSAPALVRAPERARI